MTRIGTCVDWTSSESTPYGSCDSGSEDFATLRNDPLFDASVYLHPKRQTSTRDEAINGFLARWFAVGLLRRPASNGLFRRPCVGFHPQIYAHENRDRYDASCVNPLAHFIRSGRPEGAWCHEVIVPGAGDSRCREAPS